MYDIALLSVKLRILCSQNRVGIVSYDTPGICLVWHSCNTRLKMSLSVFCCIFWTFHQKPHDYICSDCQNMVSPKNVRFLLGRPPCTLLPLKYTVCFVCLSQKTHQLCLKSEVVTLSLYVACISKVAPQWQIHNCCDRHVYINVIKSAPSSCEGTLSNATVYLFVRPPVCHQHIYIT